MKRAIRKYLPATALCLLLSTIGSSQDERVEQSYAAPAQFCVYQSQVRGSRNATVLDHFLLVDPEDHFKVGQVFIAARLKSRPGKLWLTNGLIWLDAAGPDGPISFYDAYRPEQFLRLQPVVPLSIFWNPTDLGPWAGDAEILVGYGLSDALNDSRAAFNEMLASKRYYQLWDLAEPGSLPRGTHYKVCMTTTRTVKSPSWI